MAATDTTRDKLFQYRIAMMQELGFEGADAVLLAQATKMVAYQSAGRTYEYETQLTWHDVAKVIEAGATPEQAIRILT